MRRRSVVWADCYYLWLGASVVSASQQVRHIAAHTVRSWKLQSQV